MCIQNSLWTEKNNKIHVKSIILLYQLVHNLLECNIFIVFNVLENVGEFTKPALARHLCSHCESFLFWENPGAGCRRFDREIQKSSPSSDEANWSKKSKYWVLVFIINWTSIFIWIFCCYSIPCRYWFWFNLCHSSWFKK